MRIARHSSETWEISHIPSFFYECLRDLPSLAAVHDKVKSRLYPDPVTSDGPDDLREDWREHIQPELERLFAGSREIVAKDIGGLKPSHGELRVIVPTAHGEAWLNVLNQARLIIAEKNGFTERDFQHRELPDFSTQRGMDLLRMDFYAHMQMLILEALEEH